MKKKDQRESRDAQALSPDKIEEYRKKKGLTQQAFASALGVRVATVSDWEAGKVRPTGTAKIVLTALILAPFMPLGAMLAYPLYRLLSEVFRETKTDEESSDKKR